MDSYLSQGHKHEVKCKQLCLEFEFRLLIPFHLMITIILLVSEAGKSLLLSSIHNGCSMVLVTPLSFSLSLSLSLFLSLFSQYLLRKFHQSLIDFFINLLSLPVSLFLLTLPFIYFLFFLSYYKWPNIFFTHLCQRWILKDEYQIFFDYKETPKNIMFKKFPNF